MKVTTDIKNDSLTAHLAGMVERGAMSDISAEIVELRHALIVERLMDEFETEREDWASHRAQLESGLLRTPLTLSAHAGEEPNTLSMLLGGEGGRQPSADDAEFAALRRLLEERNREVASLKRHVEVLSERKSHFVSAMAQKDSALEESNARFNELSEQLKALEQAHAALKRELVGVKTAAQTAADEKRALADQIDSTVAATAQSTSAHELEIANAERDVNEVFSREIIAAYQEAHAKLGELTDRQAEQDAQQGDVKQRDGGHLSLVSGSTHLPVSGKWGVLRVKNLESNGFLFLTPLSATVRGRMKLQYELVELGSKRRTTTGSLSAAAGIPKRVLPVKKGGNYLFRMKRVHGVPGILKVEVVPEGAPVPSDTAPEQMRVLRILDAQAGGSSSDAALVAAGGSRGRSVTSKSAIQTSASVASKYPNPNAILWQAQNIWAEEGIDKAIAFAEDHAKGQARTGIELLKANKFLDNETSWLSHLNNYVSQFSVAPIELSEGGASKFYRLSTATLPSVAGREGKVTILMPAFNAAGHLEFAATSILNQTWRNLELIIIDDASSDATYDIARRLSENDARVKVLRNRANVGPYVSKNLALRVATGDFVTGNDADDWAHPQRIQHQVEVMLGHKDSLKATVTRMLRMGVDGGLKHFSRVNRTSEDGAVKDSFVSCMFERDFLVKTLGNWDSTKFGADSEIITRAEHVLGNRFQKLRQLGMICLDSEGSLTNDPIYGISRITGISPTRETYRKAFQHWHESLNIDSAYLAFPHRPRRFAVPAAAQVPDEAIDENLKAD